jgi:anti-sigma regulatory factor (Ser/Thr protein kinase)
MAVSILSPVTDPSQTAEVRRVARQRAVQLGFEESAVERTAIVATEIATNLLKHGGGGYLLLALTEHDGEAFVEILGVDQGKGIAEIATSMRDGYSSAGTMGTGLGAIQRLSSFCDIYSQPEKGTVILARVSASESTIVKETHIGAILVPKPGEDACGDGWGMRSHNGHHIVVAADGLGHGADAAAAARAAVDYLQGADPGQGAPRGPADLLEGMHRALLPTRGAAVAIAQLDRAAHTIRFAGLGNITARICEPGMPAVNLVSMHGTAGGTGQNRFREFNYAWPEGAVLILHSDGVATRWEAKDYPGLLSRDPALICGVLFRDFRRGNDDASIVVIR